MLHWIKRHPYLTIVVVYLLSRAIALSVGLIFDVRPLIFFDQTLDPVLLRDRLLESLWYCHTQPPVMNFAIGIMLKLFGPSEVAFYLLNVGFGVGGACALYALMRRMNVGSGVSLLLVLLFFLGASALVIEMQFFYDYPLMACMCFAGLLLHRYATEGKWSDGLLFFGMVAAISLTRSLYHPVWLVAVIVSLAVANRARWRRTLLVGLPALVVVVGWYVKNLVLFGGFFASSWMGANLHAPTILKMPREERLALVARGEFTPASSADDPFLSLDSLRSLGYTFKKFNTGIPVLDMERRSTGAPNYNNPNYIDVHKDLEKDAKKILADRPTLFLRSFVASLFIYCSPASDVWPFDPNRLKIVPYDRLYNHIVFGQINYTPARVIQVLTHDPSVAPRSSGAVLYNIFHASLVMLVLVPLLTVLSGLWWWRAMRRGEGVDASVYAYIFFTLAVTGVIGNLMSIGENNRYRFVVDPYYLLLAGVLWERLRAWWRKRRGGKNSPIPDSIL